MSYSPESCIVKIFRGEEGPVIAAGFLIGKKWILTCRHVIEEIFPEISPDNLPNKTIYLTFYLDKSNKRLKSKVHFLSPERELDVAVLELEDDIPASISAGKLQNSNNLWNRKLKICGFSSGEGGEWVSIVEKGLADSYSIQINVEEENGYKIEKGFSGTPVFDVKLNTIVGMVAAKEEKPGVYSGVYIPICSIVELFSRHSIDIGIPESLYKPPVPTFFIPSLPPNYLPRQEDLGKIEELVMGDASKPVAITSEKKISAVQGMGGIGKSVLAAAFARTPQVREAFSDGIFWITIGLKPDLAGKMRMIGTKLGDDPAKYSSEVEAGDSLSKVLSDKTCLIILDDVWKVQHARPFFNSLGASCKLLITTRNDDVITSLGAKKYEIKILSEDQALRLLANWCEQEVDSLPSEAAEVARECGYLPLALSICGALARSGRQWSHILNALEDSNLKFIKHQMPDYFYDGVMASLETSISFLEQDNPDAVLRYRELVIFPPDELIPEAAILTLWMSTGNLKDYEASGLLNELENQALLNVEQKGSEFFVSLHDLQHDYLRDTIKNVKDIHEKLIDAYSKKCSGIWADGPDDNYFFKHLAYHLKEAGIEEELLDLLFDLNWMQAKLSKVLLLGDKPDVSALIHDYAYLTNNTESDLVRDAIKLSAHILARDKNQLENQLLGRLLDFDSNRIKRLLEKAHESGKKHQKLLLLNSTLKAPGGSLIRTLTGHEEGVRSVAITPDGKYAVSASDDRTLKIWDIEKGEEKATLDRHKYGVNSVTITPDGKYAVSASSDRTLKIWDIEKGEEKATLKGHEERVNSVAITPDGKYAVSASSDRTLKIWDIGKGEEQATLKGHEDWVRSVAITPDGKYAVSASSDTTLKIWDIEKGEEQATLKGHKDWVKSVVITTEGKFVVSASGDKTLKMWDIEKEEAIATLKGHKDRVNSVVITSDDKYAVSASDDHTLKIWDLEKGEEKATLKGHDYRVNSVAITPNGKYIISGSSDCTLKIWGLEKGEEKATFKGHELWVNSVVTVPYNKYAVSGSADCTLKIWDLEKGEATATLKGHKDRVESVAITPDGKYAVSASDDSTLKIWDLEKGEATATLIGHKDRVESVAITPDGKYAVSASDDHTLKIWDLEKGEEKATLIGHEKRVNSVAITHDGRYAVSGSSDHKLKIWDLERGEEKTTLIGHENWVNSVAITCDDKYAVSASDDHTLKIWDMERGEEQATLIGHEDWVNSVAITHNGRYAVSGSDDHTLKIWDLVEKKLQYTFIGECSFYTCAFSPTCTYIVAGDSLGNVYFFRFFP